MTDIRPTPGAAAELRRRVVSGVVMIAAALLAALLGGLVFAVFWTAAGIAVGVEWAWLAASEPRARRWSARLVAVTLGAAGALVALSSILSIDPWVVVAVLCFGAAAAAIAAYPAWVAVFGAPYGAAVFIGAIVLRRDPADGLLAVFWLFAVVWATDIVAYFTGRALGGPKLAPRISPNKTWSGAFGGALAGTAAGTAVAACGGVAALLPVAIVSLAASVASEFGDLFESGAKRAFGAKDSSQLIPGHGGLMDRLDGFLVAATLAAIIGLTRGGFDAAGQGLLRW
ncbi:phosphatidate cytidylyltransferase [Hansschlegelia plantiphila]|uniref:Phosphatidate cytidylyltransferase n=1 Tax=Hansschlegelia plantiphila TaxID=374655 RepID=A0A9W6J5C6_9HYPH|nr:phosphatidate cytidylyltransferase [Hansschlegelia plantiphila]GLK69515.1 phosphatidate cytidylyltransferase [Hansschlegelia plantiphila]